jgi:hypothetical protein
LDASGLPPLLDEFDCDFSVTGANDLSVRGIWRTLKSEEDPMEFRTIELSELDACCKSGKDRGDELGLAVLHVVSSSGTGTFAVGEMFSMVKKRSGNECIRSIVLKALEKSVARPIF